MSDFLLFLVVVSVLIIGHELGHFIAARLLKVRVEEFGIGFPPRLLTLFEAGGTKYTLNAIPFGGFVRPAGEDDPSVPDGLAASSKRVRASVLLAGPTINVVLGFIAFVLAFKMFAPDPNQVLITDIVPDSPADRAGILVGDLVRAVDASPITTFESMQIAISERESESVTIELQRDEQTLVVDLVPRIEYPPDQGPIGVTLGHPARATSWIEATSAGWDSIRLQVGAILSLPGRIISGVAEPEETRISGLKGIHDMLAWATSIDRTAQRPFLTLNIIGVISIGLAIANLLPFPALDGGRLVFIGIEFVLGRRISPQYESLAHAIGFILLLVLMVYFNLQDFINPIVLPR